MDASGINVFFGFQDVSIYKLSKNDKNQLQFYAQIGKSTPFDQWRKNRRELDTLCQKYPKRCTQMKYNFGTATEINNDEVVKEIIQKMQNEKLPQIQSAMN